MTAEDERVRAAPISEILTAIKAAIELRKQVIGNLIAIGWTVEQAANLEGACERAVQRWLADDHANMVDGDHITPGGDHAKD